MEYSNLVLIMILSVILLNVLANVLIKKGAAENNIYINIFTPVGYMMFSIVLIISIRLITVIELKHFSVIMAVNYLLTYLAGTLLFNEKTNIFGYGGIIFVFIGILVFNM